MGRLQKISIDGVDVTWRSISSRYESSGNWKISIADNWQPCLVDRQWWRRRWS